MTTSPHPSTNPSRRIGRAQLRALATRLGPRQYAILGVLAEHRYATTTHLARLSRHRYATDLTCLRRTNKTLQHLEQLGLIAHLDRTIGGPRGGSMSYIWRLTEPGHRLHAQHTQRAYTRRRWNEPSPHFLAHTLAITDVRVRIQEATHHRPLRLTTIETEPTCWRPTHTTTGHTSWLKPDLAITTSHHTYEDHWWIEIDLDTENPARITTKALQYRTHYDLGTEQTTRGVYPRILWVTPTEERATTLQHLFDHDDRLPPGMHTTCTPNTLLAIIDPPTKDGTS